MDCQQIIDLLDAYALGASDSVEIDSIERHVADCVRCWEELSKAQQTTALIGLSVTIEEAPARLEERIMAAARREVAGIHTAPKAGFFQRWRLNWGVAAGGLAAVTAVALFTSVQMQNQVADLEDENAALESQMRTTTSGLAQQLQETDTQLVQQAILFTVISDDDTREIEVTSDNGDAKAVYKWSPGSGMGYVECDGMPNLQPGKVYQLWITTSDEAVPLSTFQTSDGWCQVTMDLTFLEARPTGIGVSVEDVPGGLVSPAGGWVMFARFPRGE